MRLSELLDGKHFGTAQLPDGQSAPAEFVLRGHDSFVRVHSNTPFEQQRNRQAWLPVLLPDGTKVTFVQSVLAERTTRPPGDGARHALRFLPHFVTVGRRHIDESTRFSRVGLGVDDAPTIFYDFDAFSIVLSPDEHIEAVLAKQGQAIKREIQGGDQPILAYFSGKSEILDTATVFGRIRAHHCPSYSTGGPSGIRIDNRILIEIEPPTSPSFVEAIDCTMPLLRFLMIVAGRRQNIIEFQLSLEEPPGPQPMEVYWCQAPVARSPDGLSPSPGDIPINGGIDPRLFGKVLCEWLAKDEARRDARQRFATAFARVNSYNEDRMVGGANMFDILPDCSVPTTIKLPDDLADARQMAREAFSALPHSLEREGILGALSLLGQVSLKRKVRYRADILLATAPTRFPDLHLVMDEAVNCRNHFVHGGASHAGLAKSFRDQTPFLSDSLEFVFSASEFVEAGWNFEDWISRGTSMTHPWGAYVIGYKDHLDDLKAHIELRRATEKIARKAKHRPPRP